MESSLAIAEVAQRTGLSAHTLRYYERIGLIAAVPRAPGGQRRYAAADMEWLAFLMRLRETGMPIKGMQAYARLRSQGNATLAERRNLLETHLADVQLQMRALRTSAQALALKITQYRTMERSLPRQGKNAHGTPPRPERPLPARARQTP